MTTEETSRRILEVLRMSPAKFKVVSQLAKELGFKNARDIRFRRGLKDLIQKKLIKLDQSGWGSEKREGKTHPKQVILLGDIYTFKKDESQKPSKTRRDEPIRKSKRKPLVEKLIKIDTPGGDTSFITESAFKREKGEKKGLNFWTVRD